MSAARIKWGFTVVELLTVIIAVGAMLVLLLPKLAHSAAEARGATCKNKLRQVGLAALNYESAHRRFPLASMNLSPVAPRPEEARPANTTREHMAGYSW